MTNRIRKFGQGAYWWMVRRKNNIKERLGFTSYPDLKEFVYLDQTALISLLSSTTGGITQQKTSSQKQRISSSITGSLGPIGASVGEEEQKSTETVQKYVIQSNFKELYEIRKKDLAISDYVDLQPDVDAAAIENADTETLKQESSPEIQTLSRGDLIEVDATLSSSDIYEYFQVFDAFEDIVESFSTEEEFQQQLREQGVSTDEIAMILELMEILMAGLVPIECKVSNYGVYGEDQNIIVDKNWANERDIDFDEFYLAGFIDEDNLWQEPSRILFSENEFTVYGRLDSPAPGKNWSPLKLVNILDSVFPDIAHEVENLPSAFDEPKASETASNSFETTVQDYLEMLEIQADNSFPDGAINDAIDSLEDPIVAESYEEEEEILQEAEEALENELPGEGLDEYLENIPRVRANFLESRSGNSESFNESSTSEDGGDKIFLETNFIAVYW
ncbi:DUF6414 family protein [Natronococcus jeotgali]|uniref:Uncharacterized protein n=1 Tax=Natronococcus jeotgali DSM 18795 TaxID=1227498 RepID=L9XND1_9EURY|nr:hypothetical protein [Natronococcus jeotgali]ELY62153.1 hypothetical protein C492_08465 [Natronococcus jeotgali DSM 18795]